MLTPSLDELEQSEVPDHHKLVIAECVIEWARAESQLRALLTALQGKPLDSGAADYNKLSPDEAWRKIKGELLKIGAPSEVIEKYKKIGKQAESIIKQENTSSTAVWWVGGKLTHHFLLLPLSNLMNEARWCLFGFL